MAKNATIWKPLSGTGEVSNDNTGSYLKINATDYLLKTAGSTDRILLGDTVVKPKAQTAWSSSDT